MKSIFSGAGYLMADERASGGDVREADMLACAHQCGGRLMTKQQWIADGGFRCRQCDKPLCQGCAKSSVCVPFVELIDRALSEHHRREQNAKALGI